MATSTEQINDLIQAGNDWKEQADALLADRLAHQNAYEALTVDLKGVVDARMMFTGRFDNTQVSTNQEGGYWDSIADCINDAPPGSLVNIYLAEDQTFEFEGNAFFGYSKKIRISRDPAQNGPRPTLRFKAYEHNGENRLYGITPNVGGSAYIDTVDIEFEDKVNAALPWSTSAGIFSIGQASSVDLGIRYSTITGHADQYLASALYATQVGLRLHSVTLDGPFVAVKNTASASVSLSQNALTLQNGATLTDGGTIGTNILKN